MKTSIVIAAAAALFAGVVQAQTAGPADDHAPAGTAQTATGKVARSQAKAHDKAARQQRRAAGAAKRPARDISGPN